MHCDNLESIYNDVESLIFELSYSPQKFGKRILSLQEKIVVKQKELMKTDDSSSLKASIMQDKKELSDLLTVVKFIETPN